MSHEYQYQHQRSRFNGVFYIVKWGGIGMVFASTIAGAIIWMFATFHTKAEALEEHAQVTCGLLRIQAQTELANRRLLDGERFRYTVEAQTHKLSPIEVARQEQITQELTEIQQSSANLKKRLVEMRCL